jgi:O-acetyl-ADP-ribose deacetylase (regulator of RNase III)
MNHEVGDLLANVKQGVILQQVNAQNKMGSGFAKGVFEQWPLVKDAYHRWCEQFDGDEQLMGKFQALEVVRGLYVVNVVGQRFFGKDGKRYTSYDSLDDGLKLVAAWMRFNHLTDVDVHHPLIGAGLGGGHWPVIQEIITHRIGPGTTLWTLPET